MVVNDFQIKMLDTQGLEDNIRYGNPLQQIHKSFVFDSTPLSFKFEVGKWP